MTRKMLGSHKHWNDRQASNFQALYDVNGHTVRVTIHLDHYYAFQSHGIAEVMDASGPRWNTIARMPGETLRAGRNAKDDFLAFNADIDALLAEAAISLPKKG